MEPLFLTRGRIKNLKAPEDFDSGSSAIRSGRTVRAALSKQKRAIEFATKRLKRSGDLAQVSQYRPSRYLMIHSSPANLEDDAVQEALLVLKLVGLIYSRACPQPLAEIPSLRDSSLAEDFEDTATTHVRSFRCVPGKNAVSHLNLLFRPRKTETTNESSLSALPLRVRLPHIRVSRPLTFTPGLSCWHAVIQAEIKTRSRSVLKMRVNLT